MEDERNESLVPEFGKDLDAENNQGSGNNQESGKGRQLADNMKDKAKDKVKDKGKDAAKKAAKKAAKEGAKKGAAKVAMGPVIFWGTVIIVALIIIIGIIMFFVTMPGMVMEEIKKLFKELGNWVSYLYGADSTEQIEDSDVYETMRYLEEMGYDLKGFGFLTNYYTADDEEYIDDNVDSEYEGNKHVTNKGGDGVVRNGDGDIILAQSDYIFTYIASENYIYTLKNKNLVSQSKQGGLLGFVKNFITGALSVLEKVNHFLGGDLFLKAIGINLRSEIYENWGKGFIVVRTEDGELADTEETLVDRNSIKVDAESKTMSIKRGTILNNNNPITFSLDGWTGRYGMPVDFLLSVHVATMMPDLAYDMATTFPTELNLYLHKVSGEAIAYYKTVDGNYQSYGYINSKINVGDGRSIFSRIISWFDNLIETDKEMAVASELGLRHHPTECTCSKEMTYEYYYVDNNHLKHVLYTKKNDDGTETQYYINRPAYGDFYDSVDKIGYDATIASIPQEQLIEVTEDMEIKKKVYKIEYSDFCEKCKNYLHNTINVIKGYNDYNFKYYLPYIKDVQNHWYRDVYFIIDGDINPNLVTIDTDYESIYRERWTLYETYGLNDTSEYAKEHRGDFKLYIINQDNGKYLEKTIALSGWCPQEAMDKVELEGDIYLFNGTKEEAEDYGLVVSKKAITTKKDGLDDYGWNNEGSGKWSAYKFTDDYQDKTFERAYTDEQIADESNSVKKDIMGYTYVKISGDANVVQTGEGMRKETNPTIKKMFLIDTYFKYDGTHKTADIITALREKITSEINDGVVDEWYDREEKAVPYGALNRMKDYKGREKDFTNRSYTLTIDGETDTYNVADYSGQVVLNQDSLNAFSMLENTHTLDADCIYRDFKELVVELGYFTKQELTDEMPQLLAFPVAEIGSYMYPNRQLDKRENEYGTMVHSRGDIDAFEELLGEREPVDYSDLTIDERITLEKVKYKGFEGEESVVAPVTGVLLEYGTYDGTMIDTITEEPYRVNVDLKYGPVALQKAESEDEDAEDYEGPVVSDKVGYAKILVLDAENYQKLESNMPNQWKTNSLLDESGIYEDPIYDRDGKEAIEIYNELNDNDKTVYGYKEYAEIYHKTGIEGFILIIDGFKCENEDGTELTLDSFKAATPADVTAQTIGSYINIKDYKLASKTGTDKVKAENEARRKAANTLYLADVDDGLIFIKEGTVLGKTMTNSELEAKRASEGQITKDSNNIVGNYIRVILRDLDGTPVENIENMMKVDELKTEEEYNEENYEFDD